MDGLQDKDYLDKMKLFLNGGSEDKDKEMERLNLLLRNVFLATDDGREVLAFLLDQLMYNKKLSNQYEIALNNVAVSILDVMGASSNQMLINKLF